MSDFTKPPKPGKLVPMNAAAVKQAVAREATREFSSQVQRHGKKSKNFADLLSRLYAEADRSLDALEATDLSTATPSEKAKHIEAMKGLAKVLPALQQAEKNAKTSIKHKAIQDLSQDELEKLGRQILSGSSTAEEEDKEDV